MRTTRFTVSVLESWRRLERWAREAVNVARAKGVRSEAARASSDVHGPGFPWANSPMISTGVPGTSTLRLSADSVHCSPHA